MANFFERFGGRRVAFIGAGVSHRELIPLFAAGGAAVTLCDAREAGAFDAAWLAGLQEAGVALRLGPGYMDGFAGQDMILRTPGFEFFTSELQAAGAAGARLTSEMELFFEFCPCPITGITGSDGKTTTSSLIAAMLRQAGFTVHLGGNIGRPLLPIIGSIAPADVAVVELSSFQLISMRQSPHTAVVTNVTPNHLDHHRDMEEYVGAKRNILAWQRTGDLAVLGLENDITRGMQSDVKGRLRWFSRLRAVEDGAFLREADDCLCLAEGGAARCVLPRSEVALRGLHNVENLLAAMAALADSVPPEAMAAVARDFKGVEHRIEPVRTLFGVQWFNDSIATSPARVMAGLASFGQKIILIAGGYDKNLCYQPLAPKLLESVRLLILTGQTAGKIEAAVRAQPGFATSGLRVLRAADLAEAVRLAHAEAKQGDIVSLSPASAAFDAYANFEERGRHFKALVNAL